jgi:hypothetical protein
MLGLPATENVTLRTRREAQGPQGLEGTALACRFK